MSGVHRFELGCGEPNYPAQLAEIPDPPEILFGVGRAAALREGLAVVGARKATPYGIRATREFAGWAAASGYSIISGGAVGCDQAAHRAALEAGGTTIAVMGCGADIAYPRGSEGLLSEVSLHGAVVSEAPWGTMPLRWAFARRNRIIAGLARAVLVVEAALPSGTFGTADHALDSGREVLVVPGSIYSPGSRGCNRLLRQGATPITDVSELAAVLRELIGPPPSAVAVAAESIPLCEDAVYRAVLADPMRPDDLARTLTMDVVSVVRRLADLENANLVSRYADGRYGPC